jgi:transcriptional regulator with XRE-family HTH domain
MIKNALQRAVAIRKLEQVESAVSDAESADRLTWADLASELRAEISEYDGIVTGHEVVFAVDGIDGLANALVKARLARQWTQAYLADRLGTVEQQVQRDESGGYERAELHRLADVADALGYKLVGDLIPSETGTEINVSVFGHVANDFVFELFLSETPGSSPADEPLLAAPSRY